jgi:uncharacterized protein
VPRLVLIGLVAGLFSALFGVGGGIVIVPLLIVIARFSERPAMATSLAAIGIIALAGVIGYSITDRVRPVEAALIGLPAALGALAGTSLQQRLPTRTLAVLFSLFLAVVAGILLVQ